MPESPQRPKDAPGSPNDPDPALDCLWCSEPVQEWDQGDQPDLHAGCQRKWDQMRRDCYLEDQADYSRWLEDHYTDATS